MDTLHVGTVLFAIAVTHTFLVGRFRALAHRYSEGSIGENLCHLLGEVEAVFLLWAGVFFFSLTVEHSWDTAVEYVQSRNFTEPKFVFVIMVIAATKPVVNAADRLVRLVAQLLPLPPAAAFLFSALVMGPLLGSVITEPAAMTVTALILKRQFFDRGVLSRPQMYCLLGTLFVNISIGGVLTSFAAPPVLMVAHAWDWDTAHMLRHFGWKAGIAVVCNAGMVLWFLWRKLGQLHVLPDSEGPDTDKKRLAVPLWVIAVHLSFLGFTVAVSHYAEVFFGGFVFFLAFATITREYQEPLKLRSSLLVGGFLAGLVMLGGVQQWWLEPILTSLGPLELFLGAAGLTAVTDNAALTYLGSTVAGLTDQMKYLLVAGAVAGGGLTVIANAPNPAGYSILNSSFGRHSSDGISPWGLLVGALAPTLVALACFGLLP